MEFQENSTPIQHYKYMYKYQTNVVGKVHVEEVVEVISDIYLNRGSREFFFWKHIRFHQIFVQIGAILAMLQLFEIFRAVWTTSSVMWEVEEIGGTDRGGGGGEHGGYVAVRD